ncbi:MAG: hypothetical protein ACR2OU_21025 [Thermomicrobiales bacterium]
MIDVRVRETDRFHVRVQVAISDSSETLSISNGTLHAKRDAVPTGRDGRAATHTSTGVIP